MWLKIIWCWQLLRISEHDHADRLAEGMPIGINMTAKAFDEQTLFNIGLAIEEETGLKGNDVEVDA